MIVCGRARMRICDQIRAQSQRRGILGPMQESSWECGYLLAMAVSYLVQLDDWTDVRYPEACVQFWCRNVSLSRVPTFICCSFSKPLYSVYNQVDTRTSRWICVYGRMDGSVECGERVDSVGCDWMCASVGPIAFAGCAVCACSRLYVQVSAAILLRSGFQAGRFCCLDQCS